MLRGRRRQTNPNGDVHSNAINVKLFCEEGGLDRWDTLLVEGVLHVSRDQGRLANAPLRNSQS